MIHIKADPTSLGIPLAELYYYELSILSGDDVVSAGYRFYINYDIIYKWYDLITIGSLAGIDAVRIVGEVTIGIDRNYEEVEGGFATNEWSAAVKSHETAQTGIGYRRLYKGDVGHQRTIREQESLIDILLSKGIYQIIDSRFVPVIINQKNLALRKNTDKLISLPVEWSDSEQNETFTPQEIELGIGSDTEEY
jgi:hypothetical protein